jgi:hypothetical protein
MLRSVLSRTWDQTKIARVLFQSTSYILQPVCAASNYLMLLLFNWLFRHQPPSKKEVSCSSGTPETFHERVFWLLPVAMHGTSRHRVGRQCAGAPDNAKTCRFGWLPPRTLLSELYGTNFYMKI